MAFLEELERVPGLASWVGQLQSRLLPGCTAIIGGAWLAFPLVKSSVPGPYQNLSPLELPVRLLVEAPAHPVSTLTTAALLLLAGLAAGGVVDLFNTQILRMVTGHSWCDVPLVGRLSTSIQRRRFNALQAKIRETQIARDSYRWVVLTRWRHENYPPGNAPRLLPTTFGNVVSAAEYYGWDMYRFDTTVLWSRLAPLLPKEFKAEVTRSRLQVDTFAYLVVTLLALVLAAGGLTVWTYYRDPRAMSFYVVFGLVALGLAIGTYAASVTAARIWSRHIAVAIDNYRHCLIQQLGCSSLGRKWTVPEEQEVWQELTYWLKWRRLPAVHFTPPAPAKADKAKPEEAD